MKYPGFETINSTIRKTITSRTPRTMPARSVFIRAISGADDGLILESNPNRPNFTDVSPYSSQTGGTNDKNKGGESIYGNPKYTSGTIGTDWNGKIVNPSVGRVGRPNPVITHFFVKEGIDQISREATLTIVCYSPEQLDLVQTYFMEPGYSLFIEWGWNGTEGESALIRPDKDSKTKHINSSDILNAAYNRGLNNKDGLTNARINSKGNYDCYFGFITGGSIQSEADTFVVQVKMNGVPSLPTYLQSHNQIYKIDKNTGKAEANNGTQKYRRTEIDGIIAKNAKNEYEVMQRRFKNMYNQLPPQKQTEEVKKLMDNCKSGWFLNLDAVDTEKIQSEVDFSYMAVVESFFTGQFRPITGWFRGDIEKYGDNLQTKEGFDIPKVTFLNSESYIKFNLAIDILNANGNLADYGVDGKPISVKFDINDTVLQSFPMIFSTKKDKLVIPGNIPAFWLYFNNTKMVDQESLYEPKDENGNQQGTYTNIFEEFGQKGKKIEFNQETTPPESLGFKEKVNYWGYIKDLYINFNFFVQTITQSNKNIREIVLDLLNGMSDAVNSFWNFQIVEKSNENGILTFKIIDENWSGQYEKEATSFAHSGPRCVFLEATLDSTIPAEMANQIILRRNQLASNPNQPIIDVNEGVTFFGAKNDRFLSPILKENPKPDPYKYVKPLNNSVNGNLPIITDVQKAFLGNNSTSTTSGTQSTNTTQINTTGTTAATVGLALQGNFIGAAALQGATSAIEEEQFEEAKKQFGENLDKLNFIPNPTLQLGKSGFLPTSTEQIRSGNFFVVTFDDTNLFDVIRNKMFYRYDTSGKAPTPAEIENKQKNKVKNRVSPILPIKYSFKTFGISGIERGTVFNIDGLPGRYKECGFFQITDYEHDISNNMWVTTITGGYRQFQ